MAEYVKQYAVEQFHKKYHEEMPRIDMENLIRNIILVKVRLYFFQVNKLLKKIHFTESI